MDKRVEDIIISSLKKTYPKHSYLPGRNRRNKRKRIDLESVWVIDPLDGTTNYIHGFPYYAITIAYVEKGKTLPRHYLRRFKNKMNLLQIWVKALI
ncbi:MAG: hypothetical protein CM1200mP12_02380 [Gammaproteobacteria bacterium]|nr:MAG: hypothetical protein CM1200mP12_02380 [Gammaproteobacteria bacterium]